MEEMLEVIVVIIIAAIGIASKANKKKKVQKPKQPAASAWDELAENVEKRFDEFIEKNDGEPVIPYAPSQPAAAPQPAQPQPVPVQPVIIAKTVPEIHVEGMPAEPVPMPQPKPRPRPRPAAKPDEPIKTVHHTSRSRVLPERITAGTLRSAVVMSEVLGKPVALKNTARR